MTASDPRRRRADTRPPRPALIAPTPSPLPTSSAGAEVVGSIDNALAEARRGRRHVTLVSLRIDGDPTGFALDPLADLVRRTVRSGDGLWRDGEAGLALLLADVDGPSVEPVLARMRLRLRHLPGRKVRIGRAAAPPGIGAADLLDLARADRDRA